MTASRSSRLVPVVAAALLAACRVMPESPREPGVPQITEAQLRDKAKESLGAGLRQYQLGDYDDAQKSLTASLDHGLLSKREQSTARKHLAFIHCVSGRRSQCENEFRKAMEIDPGFDLTAAEAGHPSWGPVYRSVRAQLAAPAPPPQPKPAAARTVAGQLLADGMAKYDAGDFDAALKSLQSALTEGLTDKSDKLKAHKHSAFSLCLLRRPAQCRSEFAKIFEIDPGFELAPAEAGHPSWAKTYAGVKQRARQAKEKAAKDAAKKK
jgi:tetratricopeptide (TPR) repeat protein